MNTSQGHVRCRLDICDYLIGTTNYEVVIAGNLIKVFRSADSFWGANRVDCRWTAGYKGKPADGMFSQNLWAQGIGAVSLTEAEDMCVSAMRRWLVD